MKIWTLCAVNTDTYEKPIRRADIPSLYNRRLQDITVLIYKVKLYLNAFLIYLREKALLNIIVSK